MLQEIKPSPAHEASLQTANQSYFANQSLQEYLHVQKDMLRDSMNNTGSDGEKASLAEMLEKTADSIKYLAERGDFLKRRLDHAIKRLDAKKLYTSDMDELAGICLSRGLVKAASMLQVARCCMGESIIGIGTAGELDENCWRIGIDMAMSTRMPELAEGDQMYGLALEPNYPYICIYTVMAAHGAKMNHAMKSDAYKDAILRKTLGSITDNDTIMTTLMGIVDEMCNEREEKLVSRADKAETERDKALSQLDGLRQSLAAYEKENRPDKARADRLQDENRELQDRISGLNGQISSLRDALDKRDRDISRLARKIQDQNLPELPKKNVVFLGGHPNMTKKLKQDHPGWTFIEGSEHTFPEFQAPEIVFFWTKHMGHPAWQRAMGILPPEARIAYVTATNLDNLELEMRRAWAAVNDGLDA